MGAVKTQVALLGFIVMACGSGGDELFDISGVYNITQTITQDLCDGGFGAEGESSGYSMKMLQTGNQIMVDLSHDKDASGSDLWQIVEDRAFSGFLLSDKSFSMSAYRSLRNVETGMSLLMTSAMDGVFSDSSHFSGSFTTNAQFETVSTSGTKDPSECSVTGRVYAERAGTT